MTCIKKVITDSNRGEDLLFVELTPALLSKFEDYLHLLKNEREPDKKLHPNTVALNLNIFKTLVKRAIEIENFMKPDKNPFMAFSYKKGIKTMKEKLTSEEIQKIIDVKLPEQSLIWHCRNYFMFRNYCAGIRVGDLIQLRWRNIASNGRIEYEMAKNSKYRDLVLVDQAKKILSYYLPNEVNPNGYIFPLLDSSAEYAKSITKEQIDTLTPDVKKKLYNQIESKTSLINKYLKKIAVKAEINKNLSMHIARHSFGKRAKDMNTDSSVLKTIFAHSSVKITENYTGDFETQMVDQALKEIFEEKTTPNDMMELLKNITPEQENAIRKLLQQK